jgi:hypothetical protein
MNRAWAWTKANALAEGWRRTFAVDPPFGAVVLGLAVAIHETKAGDAWPGEHNWGACTRRALNQAERFALSAAGVHAVTSPADARVAAELSALATLTSVGLAPTPDLALHIDSSPSAGAYFTWFAAFANDDDGAAYFVEVLAKQRSSCKSVLETTNGSETMLAAAMYKSHYFTGFHDPSQPGGADANIAEYALALYRLTPELKRLLVGWTPGATAPPLDLDTVLGVQQALNRIGASAPPLVEDGVLGPLTRTALVAFQAAHGLVGTGLMDDATKAALRAALATS